MIENQQKTQQLPEQFENNYLDEKKDKEEKKYCQDKETQNKRDKYEALTGKYKPVEVDTHAAAIRPYGAECRW